MEIDIEAEPDWDPIKEELPEVPRSEFYFPYTGGPKFERPSRMSSRTIKKAFRTCRYEKITRL